MSFECISRSQVSFITTLSRTIAPGETYTPGESTERSTRPRTIAPLQIMLCSTRDCGPNLAGGRSSGLSVLAQTRSVAAVPFAGKFRLIDFTLSNCVNSELYTVAVLAQYAPLSLAAYVGRGEPWDLNRRDGGVTVLQPYVRQEGARWYEGSPLTPMSSSRISRSAV